MNRATRIFLLKLLAVVAAMVAAWLFLPQKTELGNTQHQVRGQKIVIIPSGGIPQNFLMSLEKSLEESHKMDVLIVTEMGLDDTWQIPEQAQYNANILATYGANIMRALNRKDAFGIILTNKDINYPNSGLRFVFSAHYEGLSVISLARINPRNTGISMNLITVPLTFEKTKLRALKLINKSIGLGYYQYPISSEKNSVMYGPIMGLDDLDSVGDWYRKK